MDNDSKRFIVSEWIISKISSTENCSFDFYEGCAPVETVVNRAFLVSEKQQITVLVTNSPIEGFPGETINTDFGDLFVSVNSSKNDSEFTGVKFKSFLLQSVNSIKVERIEYPRLSSLSLQLHFQGDCTTLQKWFLNNIPEGKFSLPPKFPSSDPSSDEFQSNDVFALLKFEETILEKNMKSTLDKIFLKNSYDFESDRSYVPSPSLQDIGVSGIWCHKRLF